MSVSKNASHLIHAPLARLSSFFLSWPLSFAQCIALYCICIDGTPVSSYHLQLASHDMAKSEDNRKSKFLGLLLNW